MSNITCDAFCFNDMHKQWLEGVLDRAMLRFLTDSEGPNTDKGFCDDIKKNFASSIRDAEQLFSLDATDEPAPPPPKKREEEN